MNEPKQKREHKNCRHLLGTLSEYIDGELSEELCHVLEQHIDNCEDCRIVVDTLRKTVNIYHKTSMTDALFIAGDLVFGVGVVLLLVGFAIWGVSRVLTLQSQQDVDATAPSISEILLVSPEAPVHTSTPPPDSIQSFPGQPTITVVIPTLSGDVNVQLNLVAAERTYMRVIVDGEVVFEGRVGPGTAYPYEAQDRVEVLVGNGAAIRVVYNGRDLGLLGSLGQVVSTIYRADEIVTPTGLPTATGTITLTPTQTPVPSATSRFTATLVTPVPSNSTLPRS